MEPTTTPAPLPAAHAALLANLGWEHTATLAFPGRPAAFASPADLPPLPGAASLLAASGRLYRHQALALSRHLAGENVVLATGTGSGKTRVFHLAAASALDDHPRSLVLALYPGKALAREQAAKWHAALVEAGLATPGDRSVALIDGDHTADRAPALASAKIAILTPDVLHSWALANLANRTVRQALARTRLVVLDEAHTLAGVFGSNSLLLLRRLQSALHALRAPAPRWLAASATLASPASHLAALTGLPFHAITEADDTSLRHLRRLHFIRPSATALNPGLQTWLRAVASSARRFVVFTQSRRQTELLAQLANRSTPHDSDPAPADVADPQTRELLASIPRIAPYRSGLDPSERADLQDRFACGDLHGLVCTSAFELGIDLPGLDLGFLVGLPDSPASFWQRLGRFGRHGDADIFLIDDARPAATAAFAHPASLLAWQARDAALYPENPILLARHVLCLAHETAALGLPELPSSTPLPAALRALHAALLRGEPTPALREAQAAQGNTTPPHLAFPLRTCDEIYRFKGPHGGPAPSGFITYGQILREAYPGAVYYHGGTPWRILSLNRRDHTLTVARERHYHTQPRAIPSQLVPDLSQPVYADLRWPSSGLRLVEARARATEAVTGCTELRGNRSADTDYAQGAFGQTGPLYRSYETTAMLLAHPGLDPASPATLALLGALLREALLLTCPREASELASATGTLKADRRDLACGTRFLALYDTVPGSLRLSSAFAEPATLRATLALAARLADQRHADSPDLDSRAAHALARLLLAEHDATAPAALPAEWPDTAPALVFSPGTPALHRKRQLAVTIVRAFTDLDGALHYEIRRIDDPAFHGTVAADALAELPGQSHLIPLAQALAA